MNYIKSRLSLFSSYYALPALSSLPFKVASKDSTAHVMASEFTRPIRVNELLKAPNRNVTIL